MFIQFPKHVGSRKPRRKGIKSKYNALRIHPGKAYRIHNGIDDLPEWPQFPPPVHHRGPAPPNRMFVDGLGFQRPLQALPANDGLPATYSSRAANYITHGLVAQAPLIGICLTLGYYLALVNQEMGFVDMANSLLEEIPFPFIKPKKRWNFGDKDFQWIYDREFHYKHFPCHSFFKETSFANEYDPSKRKSRQTRLDI